jgi:hypothetical protein
MNSRLTPHLPQRPRFDETRRPYAKSRGMARAQQGRSKMMASLSRRSVVAGAAATAAAAALPAAAGTGDAHGPDAAET